MVHTRRGAGQALAALLGWMESAVRRWGESGLAAWLRCARTDSVRYIVTVLALVLPRKYRSFVLLKSSQRRFFFPSRFPSGSAFGGTDRVNATGRVRTYRGLGLSRSFSGSQQRRLRGCPTDCSLHLKRLFVFRPSYAFVVAVVFVFSGSTGRRSPSPGRPATDQGWIGRPGR